MHVVSSLGLTMGGLDSMVYAYDAAIRDLRATGRVLPVSITTSSFRMVKYGNTTARVSEQKKVGLFVIGTHSQRVLTVRA